jgi:hypothetical protein
MRPDVSIGRARANVWVCDNCPDVALPRRTEKELQAARTATVTPKKVRQGKLLLQPGIQSNRIHIPEETIQAAAVRALTYLGYIVQVTTERRKGIACTNCGHWNVSHKGSGVSKATSDLLVRNPQWHSALFLAEEMKGTKTILSPEQKHYEAAGHIHVNRSVEDVLANVHRMDLRLLSAEEMQTGPAKRLTDYLMEDKN